MPPDLILTISNQPEQRRRRPRDPKPRFKSDRTRQLDAIRGCPAALVSDDHLARSVWQIVCGLEMSLLENTYSPLGRHGYHPRHVLAVWVYASLVGLHYSTKVARALETDAAFQFLSGGYAISAPTLRRFRQRNREFFQSAIEQTIACGAKKGLVSVEQLAVDSVRIRAHASTVAVRTVARSSKRLEELAKVDPSTLDEQKRERHEESVAKHRAGLAECEARSVASIVTTNEAAALMKFPSGASAPGHRTTVIASGASARFVIGVLVDADPTDHGKLTGAVQHARDVLDRLGLRDRRLQVAADAGYHSDRDLQFALEARDWADILIPQAAVGGRGAGFFGRDRFVFHDDGSAVCPAGTPMLGPYPNDKTGKCFKWVGVGCETCALKPQCTSGKLRSIQLDADKERAREAMRERMASPDAAKRYNQRIATVEPVFSFLEDTMGFRRSSSRKPQTVVSEILLKILAYNIDRLIRAERASAQLLCVYFAIAPDRCYEVLIIKF